MSQPKTIVAVDLGATSGRVAAVDLSASEPSVEVVHRWANWPVTADDGSLRWDWAMLTGEVQRGLASALGRSPVASIGIDGWGVDYGLIDDTGALLTSPFCYRDRRTDGWRSVVDRIGREKLYRITGIQLMGINTIFQLAAHLDADAPLLQRAHRALLLPDLLVNRLTGWIGVERSNASTTGLLDARTGQWSPELLDDVGVPAELLPSPVSAAASCVGTWRGVPVHLVGSHDTASAFLGMPGGREPGTVFVSTGTWIIVGVELPEADTSAAAAAANFSNEAGAFGGVRLLKNVVGFWLLEQCRPGWGEPPVERLFAEASGVAVADAPLFDARDERFVSPDDMEAEIREATGLGPGAERAVVVRSIVESMAAGVAAVVDELRALGVVPPRRLAVTGGGARAELLCQALERHCGLPVLVGSTEATALGNAVAQGVALGHFADPADGRDWIAHATVERVYGD
ncbi:MAG: FGGY-family carbohydrate kinase [Acidimicrobiia bacterium]|nr:FGGY-family carbohydrate kinase [Acidimicrobiia bacterium]